MLCFQPSFFDLTHIAHHDHDFTWCEQMVGWSAYIPGDVRLRGDEETRRHGDTETRGEEDEETRGESQPFPVSPRPPLSASPPPDPQAIG